MLAKCEEEGHQWIALFTPSPWRMWCVVPASSSHKNVEGLL